MNAIDDTTVEISGGGRDRDAKYESGYGPARVHLLSVEAGAGAAVEGGRHFSEFREVEGIKFPVQFTILNGGRKFADVTVTEIRLNTGLEGTGSGKKAMKQVCLVLMACWAAGSALAAETAQQRGKRVVDEALAALGGPAFLKWKTGWRPGARIRFITAN